MLKRIALFLFLLIPFSYQLAVGQAVKSFSDETNAFFSELNAFFDKVANKDDKQACEYMLAEFTNAWNSGLLTKEHKQNIIHVSNLMLKRRLKPYPDFFNYYSSNILDLNSSLYFFPTGMVTSSSLPSHCSPIEEKLRA